MTRTLLRLALMLPFAASLPALAQVETVRTPLLRPAAEKQVLGAQFRARADRAAEAALRQRLPEAEELLEPVIEYCSGLAQAGRLVVGVANIDEYRAHVASQARGQAVDWVDMACPGAYKTRAFIDIDKKDHASALAFLDKAILLAPYWAEPLAERGYLLDQLGKPSDALADYLRALELVDRFQSNAYAKALVLRGLGYTHVELGDLDAAEQAYRKSLEAEPGNALAQRELDYIRKQREAAKP